MSSHLAFELDNVFNPTLTQTITMVYSKRIAAICPKLAIVGAPDGTFTLSVVHGVTTLASKSLTIAAINAGLTTEGVTTLDHKLGYIKFEFSSPINLRRGNNYDLVLSSSGYTYSEASGLYWIKEHENETNELEDTPLNDAWNSYSYHMWSY